MAVKVDTYEIRRAARQLQQIAVDVRAMSTGRLNAMQSTVKDELKGQTADAMSSVLENLSSDARRISQSLTSIQQALQAYADQVEETARKNAELF